MAGGVGAIVPAAGQGLRLGMQSAKAFVRVAGAPLIVQTLRALHEAACVRWIVLVVPPGQQSRMQRVIQRAHLTRVCAIVEGASSRAGSVARGFAALPRQAKWVLIHDGARPCVTPALIESTVAKAKRHGAVACGLPASVTVKSVDADWQVRLTLDREGLWFVQTPQVFCRDWLTEALSRVNGLLDRFPDDAAILEWAGFRVHVVPGDPLNIKVTTREDLVLAEAILRVRGSRFKARD
ncbi:MAG TPA: 2-C-methyl-D-erythritol 4-phosphate cytidylyltransferase [Candidatus Omnitrophica bacterium]|nr:MAG: 2-C-methyl-D-erythritol 4-phosphate cytidylyltransferase [Omnitrophica WOR_2 bacterium GWA2_63_20]OGX16656.1 MAG: 2-C-methyl-D-erythritol 4-phosphate cytidylyltransferase [Omnitrophica WOR_2 bacterium GWF2_63_9]OGX32277.1 MAG: 2-C-methyl-D-erythritol 4-phosphate cytidylyltransferase [Omnitrophica WOR_2 bacterium RIFCSPHIGHO2_12_FULL_64_13]OGX35397.1 MAG: 2-C-methyl-D-erythritol 4-phosphate cytidylyltransferase [Omnitrophica WOR_2 bacterium RIFCSPHIGHO2_02_FULL_63_39]OGX45435.1 MAG: 2-C-